MKTKMIAQAARNELARRSLCDFAVETDPRYMVNWHHRMLCDYLDRFARREIPRLMVSLPPRHGKSELVSRKLPAYLFGLDPNASIIATSYSADLAQRMNRDTQRIIDSERYAEIFPDTKLFGKNIRSLADGSYLRNSDIFEIVGHRGAYRSAGVGGGITGMGGDYIIIDDPLKNREEASSVTIREKMWEWYTSTLYTRLEKDGSILLTMTRWHEDDLAGRLLRLAESDPAADQWTVISFPAIAETVRHPEDPRCEGEALWPDKYSIERLAGIKVAVGSYDWNALYQQHPAPSEGGLFKREYWKYWRELPPTLTDWMQSWDCAFKATNSSDYVVGQVWARDGANRYLVDQVRKRMTFTETVGAIRDMTKLYPQTYRKLIEDKANGSAVIDTLSCEITGIIPVEPQGGKEARAQAVSAAVESGNVYLPHSAPWLGDFVEECASFPNAAHDDQVDAMTQALVYYGQRAGSIFSPELVQKAFSGDIKPLF
ncbi:MAG: phage terminase large subunit [Oscillospiraceae bacterium]|nr:phage terminase large subunit [Oscillospiraceae bacterium]